MVTQLKSERILSIYTASITNNAASSLQAAELGFMTYWAYLERKEHQLIDWRKGTWACMVARNVTASALASMLALGCAGLTACANIAPAESDATKTAEAETASAAPEDYSVYLEVPTGKELVASLKESDAPADLAEMVTSAEVSVDSAKHQVDMVVQVNSSDLEKIITAAEAIARELSVQSEVTAPDGSKAPDDGPCGALYEAYDLYIRASGLTPADVFDGTLPAGGDEVMWQ